MKKFWQHLIIWQKAAIFLFVFLSVIFIMIFLESKGCLKQNLEKFNLIKKEGVEMITNKTLYQPGEKVKLVMKNYIQREINISGVTIEQFKNKEWMQVRFDVDCPCLAKCKKLPLILSVTKNQKEFVWDQIINNCRAAEEGRYRFKSSYWRKNVAEKDKVFYSNEFTIRNTNEKELFIQTDKAQYQEGEKITAKIQNNFDEKIVFNNISISTLVEKFFNSSLERGERGDYGWKEIRDDIECPCSAECDKISTVLAPGEYRSFSGDLKNNYCEDLPVGEYKISVNWKIGDKEGYSYSDEFTIVDDNKKQEQGLPIGHETEAFFDQVTEALENVENPDPYPMMGSQSSIADLNGDGIEDVSDIQIFEQALNSCFGEKGYNLDADLDTDGCVTSDDYRMFMDIYNEENN